MSESRGPVVWIRRLVIGIFVFAVVALLFGALFERLASDAVARRNPPVGRLVLVQGGKQHIYCSGVGSPRVIFVSGLGDGVTSWSKVQPEVAKFTQACSYDRTGLGWSNRGASPRDIHTMVVELHDLLESAGIPPPYLLVGHSLGGGVIRVYAARYPEEVRGLVMVDAMHPEFLKRMQLDEWDERMLRTARRMKRLAPFAAARLLGLCEIDNRPLVHCAEFWATFAAEREALPRSAQQVGEVRSLGSLPLEILSRDPSPSVGWGNLENRTAWERMQEELPQLSSRASQKIVTGATHYIQEDRPDVVIEAISHMFATIRDGVQ